MAAVYWIQKDGDTDIHTDGYVGYTKRDPGIRKEEHWASGKTGTFHVIAEGTVKEMCALESELRPHSNIGDNIAPGGHIGGGGHERTPETRERMRQARIGTKWDSKVKGKISQSLKGRFKWITNGTESKSVPADESVPEGWRRGRTLPEMVGEKNHFFGKKHTEETRRKMRKPRRKRQ